MKMLGTLADLYIENATSEDLVECHQWGRTYTLLTGNGLYITDVSRLFWSYSYVGCNEGYSKKRI